MKNDDVAAVRKAAPLEKRRRWRSTAALMRDLRAVARKHGVAIEIKQIDMGTSWPAGSILIPICMRASGHEGPCNGYPREDWPGSARMAPASLLLVW